jgi:hypothetical protein
MKYWRVVRVYFCRKYNITTQDLEMLMFLYSEKYFTRKKFREYESVFPFSRKRLTKLAEQGFIERFATKSRNERIMYAVSEKTNRLVKSIYAKLSGDPFPTDRAHNPFFNKNESSSQIRYMKMMENINEVIRQKQDPFL